MSTALINKIKIAFCILAVLPFFASAPALAQSGDTCTAGPCGSDYCYIGGTCVPKSPSDTGFFKPKTLGELIKLVIQTLLSIAGVISVIFIIIGGYQYITAGGNDEQAEKGRKALTNAVIGVVVVMLSFVVVTVVTNFITKGTI